MTDKRNFNENEDKSLPKEEGLIIKATGGFYYVLCGEVTYECRARGIFRKREQSPLVGDRVTVSVLPNEKGYIYAIHERKNSLVRPPLANIDQLVMVVSVAEPAPNLLVMDKLIAVAEHQDVEPVLVFTKCDLADPAPYAEIYRKAGFRVYEVCSTERRGTGAVLEMLRGRVSAFCGNSGAGKSTLLNEILPELSLSNSAEGGIPPATRSFLLWRAAALWRIPPAFPPLKWSAWRSSARTRFNIVSVNLSRI